MDNNRVLNDVSEAGKILLANGAETYRVEDTSMRIALAFGFKSADIYATPTVIILDCKDKYNISYSRVLRIEYRTFNLDKIAKINNLSRNIENSELSLDAFENQLNAIEFESGYTNIIAIICAAIAAAFFTLIFKGNINDFFCAFFIGAIIKYTLIYLSKVGVTDFFTNTVGGMEAAFLAIVLYKLNLCSHYDKTIIGSIMLLVPGISITNALRDTISGDLVSGITRGIEAVFTAIAIALGTGIIFKIWFGLFGGVKL
ncbi:MAG: threonine/serine exporter family protein [Clostridium sp.]|nr:threonine/serine exporter family protein [Clostridium sp.]